MAYAPPRDEMRIKRLQTIVNGKPMTQIDACRKLKIPQTTYSAYERGILTPPPKTARKIIKLYNLPADYFKPPEEETDDEQEG